MTREELRQRNAWIVERYQRGELCFEIAASLNVDRSTVWRAVRQASAKRRSKPVSPMAIKWTPEMDAELRRVCEAGLGIMIASERIGVSVDVARKRRNLLGLPRGASGKRGHEAHRRFFGSGQKRETPPSDPLLGEERGDRRGLYASGAGSA